MEGTARRDCLWASGVSKWYIDGAPAGILDSVATMSSECLLAIQSPAVSVSFNNEFPSSHVISPTKLSEPSQHSPSMTPNESETAQSPSSILSSTISSTPASNIPHSSSWANISPTSAEHNSCNYLAILTLAWTYVLSSYWAEIQDGVTEYTTNQAPVLAKDERPGPDVTAFHLPEMIGIEQGVWWRAILAPTGWKSQIERHGREWISPWSLSVINTKFAIVSDLAFNDETDYDALSFSQSVAALRNFANSYGLLGQARMALMAALSIPTHNLHKITVNLPRPNHRLPTIRHDNPQNPYHFDGLVQLIPQLVTISSSAYASHLRSAFYDDSVHSMECGQWIRPAIIGWPEFSPLAVAVGSIRCPKLINWWGGMGISGLLSKHAVGRLAGSCMWPTDLAFFTWTGSKHSYFCRVEEDGIQLTVNGKAHNRIISRADEALMLFITSGQGPHRRLSDLSSSPWRPPGEVWFEKSGSHVIRAGDVGLKAQLVYLSWEWRPKLELSETSGPQWETGTDINRMAEDSGCATRAILGWLGNARGPEADINVELLALRQQQQLVEDDSQVGGSGSLSGSDSGLLAPSQDRTTPSPTVPIHGVDFADADLVDQLEVEKNYVVENFGVRNPGWCGLDAINHGLTAAGLTPIGREEALCILARTEMEIERLGMSVRDLENLLNARNRSVGIIDVGSGMNWKLKTAREEVVLIAADFRHHFMGITKRQEA